MDTAQFRVDFPEFADEDVYTDTQITFWNTVAEKLVNEDAWTTLYDFGVSLLIAHNLVVQKRNEKTAAVGGTPGVASGSTSSKQVGDVNTSYDTQNSSEKDAGMYNSTSYGQQFIHYARLFGAGAIQL